MSGKIFGGTIAILCLIAGAAIAGEGADAGSTAFVPLTSEQVALPNGQTMQRIEASGINMTKDAESPLNGSGITCEGVFIAGPDGTAQGGGGSCHLVTADGDVAFAWWKQTSEGSGVWGLMGGTGSFEGITGKGNYAGRPPLPNGSWINDWDISWKIK
jgi:hypothetical protein